MKLMLIGADGQVGWELVRALATLGEVVALDRTQCDLSQIKMLSTIVQEIKPDVIVNAAAYTQVDQAEQEEPLATIINGDAVGALAEESKKINALLIHYSTDYVFDGSKSTPYTEDDATNPVNAYGRTKLAGEEAIRQSGCSYCIFRTSWIHSTRGTNFIKTIVRLASERDELKVVSDQIGAPTSARLIAQVTCEVLQTMDNPTNGLFHLTASGETNWFEYAKYILQLVTDCGSTLRVTPDEIISVCSVDYPTEAKRPLNSRLTTEKLSASFGIDLPHWKLGVKASVEGIMHCQC